MDSVMGSLPAILALMIPIVAVAGWYGYNAVEKWHDVEEKRIALQATTGAPELQHKVRSMEQELTMLRRELAGTVQDIDERLARIEILLREVE